MDAAKLPIRSPYARIFPFLLRTPSSTLKPDHRRMWILIASLFAAFVFLYLAIACRSSAPRPPRFGIIIDAGSSGTRIHVFASNGEAGAVPRLDLGLTTVTRVTPGLSSYSEEPERAGESLVELLEFAKGKVSKDRWMNTEVRLMATAGLRMVEMDVRERILESCRTILRSSGFRFHDDWATVIPGSEEGTYAWVAANYALGTLGGDPENTTGIIELGGASAQVTFVSSDTLPPEFSRALTFGNTTYKLYTNSFLHFGQDVGMIGISSYIWYVLVRKWTSTPVLTLKTIINAAHESLWKLLNSRDTILDKESDQDGTLIDPCSPKGSSHGGNYSKCRSAALTLLQKEKDNCQHQLCHFGSTLIPKMQGNFIATENFFYTSKFFGLDPTSSLSDLMLAGQEFCEEDWVKIKEKYHSVNEEDLSKYCFSAAYIVVLLHDNFGFPLDERRIVYANHVGDIDIEWALGAYVVQSSKASTNLDWSASIIHDDLFLLLFVASVLLVFAIWLLSKWRRPQMKTIFDLEKGRYIVTHAN